MRRSLFAVPVALVSAVAPLSFPLSPGVVSSTPQVVTLASVARVPVQHIHHVAKRSARATLAQMTIHELSAVAATFQSTIGELRAKWQHVAVCEVGGNWSMVGSWYSGIGFLNSTWAAYGGTRFAPLAGQATRDQQILIGMKVTNGWVPDQYGCSPNGW